MKKLTSLFAALFLCLAAFADSASFDLSKAPTTQSDTVVTWVSDYVTLTLEKAGSQTKANNYLGGDSTYTHTRVYKSQVLTIAPATGYSVSELVFTATAANYATILVNSTWTNATATAAVSEVTVTITDPTKEATVTFGAATRFTLIEYTYSSSALVPTTTLSVRDASVKEGGTVKLDVSADGNSPITWSSSDETVATVSNGIVTGVKAGTATITATVSETLKATCTVTVTDVPKYNYKRVTAIETGKNYVIAANVNGTMKVAVPLTNVGKTYGYNTAIDVAPVGKYIVLEDTIYEYTFTGIDTIDSGYTIKEAMTGGKYVYMAGTYNSFNVGDAPTEGDAWTVVIDATTSVAKITNVLKAKYVQYSIGYNSYGAYETAQSNATDEIYLYESTTDEVKEIEANSLTISGDATVKARKQITLVAEKDDAEASGIIEWKSSDETVATVVGGVVTGLKEGTATITAYITYETKEVSATKEITVTAGNEVKEFTVTEALDTIAKLADNVPTDDEFIVRGYVTTVTYQWSESANSLTALIAAEEGGTATISAFKVVPVDEASRTLESGDYVEVFGNLEKYVKSSDATVTPEILANIVPATIKLIAKSGPAQEMGEISIADFLAKKDLKNIYTLTGIVRDTFTVMVNEYGRIYLSDSTAEVYVYGVLKADSTKQKYQELGVETGDTLTIKGIYSEYKGNPQVANALFVSVKKYIEPLIIPDLTGKLIKPSEALELSKGLEEDKQSDVMYSVLGYVTEVGQYDATTHIQDVEVADAVGVESVYSIPAAVVNKAVKVGDKILATSLYLSNVPSMGDLLTYAAKEGAVVTVVPADYEPKEDTPSTALDSLSEFDANAPMYNIMGQKVNVSYKGIVIQNGRKYLLR